MRISHLSTYSRCEGTTTKLNLHIHTHRRDDNERERKVEKCVTVREATTTGRRDHVIYPLTVSGNEQKRDAREKESLIFLLGHHCASK